MNENKSVFNTGEILSQLKSMIEDNADTGSESTILATDNDAGTDEDNWIIKTAVTDNDEDDDNDTDADTGEDDDKPIVKRGEVGYKDIDSVVNCNVDCTLADFFGILRDLGFNEDDEVFSMYADNEVMTKNIADELEFISCIDTDLLKRRFENLVEYTPRNITVARYLACCKRLGIDADSARVF